jgi:hypothetical protein
VIVAYRNGAPVRVRDIGRAVAAATDRFAAAYHDNAQAILLSVYKQPGAHIIDTVEQIKSLLPKLTANIPAAMRSQLSTQRNNWIAEPPRHRPVPAAGRATAAGSEGDRLIVRTSSSTTSQAARSRAGTRRTCGACH